MLTLTTRVKSTVSRFSLGKRLVCVSLAVMLAVWTLAVLRRFPALASRSYLSREVMSSPARLSDQVSVRAMGFDPRVSLGNGHDLLTSYQGPEDLKRVLMENQAQPQSLASADFDEDGVPDLVSGYAYNGQGIVTLLGGNVDSIYPNAPEAQQRRANGTFTEAPFLSPARVFATPVAADFMGAGDFDADGHWDLVVGSRSSDCLFLWSGDGRGGLKQTKEIRLPGRVTAMTTGEMNRADGLTDIVVGVEHAGAAQVLVFEGPAGALRAAPEVFAVAAPVTSVQLAQLDGEYTRDLAIAAADTLVIICGRDRKLSLDEHERAKVSPAKTSLRQFNATIIGLAAGNFTADFDTDLAVATSAGTVELLSSSKPAGIDKWSSEAISAVRLSQTSQLTTARISTSNYDDLIITDKADNRLQVLQSTTKSSAEPLSAAHLTLEAATAPMSVLPMRLTPGASDSLIVLQKNQVAPAITTNAPDHTFTVINTNATGPGSLQFAILDANETPGADLINFNIPGTGPFTISPTASLPAITEPVTVDATTQPGYAGQPVVIINGASAGNGSNAFTISSNTSVIRGFRVQGYKANGSASPPGGDAVNISGSNNIVEGNFVGAETATNQSGVFVTSGTNNRIGGTTPVARNVIASVTFAVILAGGANGNNVQGNYMGTDPTGTASVGSGGNTAVLIGSFWGQGAGASNTIGGTTAGSRNVISSAFTDLVQSSGQGNLVQGNYLGTDVTGTSILIPLNLQRAANGVQILAISNTIGGTSPAARNLIAGTGQGVRAAFGSLMGGDSGDTLIQGNYIGTKSDGTGNLGTIEQGIYISLNGAMVARVGGIVAGAGNLISNSGKSAIEIGDDCVSPCISLAAGGHTVQGNLIGTDSSGTTDLGNIHNGVYIRNVKNNLVGGTSPAARNVISGNGLSGVLIEGAGATGNVVAGNYIGTNTAGTAAIGNDLNGVTTSQAPNNTIGGATTDARNIISGNARHGVSIGIDTNSGATGITVQNNYIGTDVGGNNCVGNLRDGVFVNRGSVNHTIIDNLITCNGRNGVNIPNFSTNDPGIRIEVTNNSIFANALLGIDLGNAGITPNTADGLPRNGEANLRQNFPVLTSVTGATSPNGKPMVDNPGVTVTVNATLKSNPSTNFTVHWYFSSDAQCVTNQAASRPLITGKVPNVMTNSDGDAQFGFPLELPVGVNTGIVNCTATDPQGNTSEFSACLAVSSASPTPTPTPPQLILDPSGPAVNQAAALEVQQWLRDPFPVLGEGSSYTGSDRNTRVLIFVTNLELLPGEGPADVLVNLVASNNQNFDVTAEDVRLVPNQTIFKQVTFRLPSGLVVGTCTVKVKVHGQFSNAATFRIRI